MKGYPKTRFEIVNQTQIQEIPTNSVGTPTALIMAPYTSDKGSEEWELMFGLENFTLRKGGISFAKHGQAQLTVAECLRNGAYVLGKRMVSEDATLANMTIKVKLVKVDDAYHVYFYGESAVDVRTLPEAVEAGYGDFNPDADIEDEMDIPLFTIAALGRGASALYFRINPEYIASKSTSFVKYSFEIYENTELIESIMFTMNPDIVVDGVAQGMNPKIRALSNQVKVKYFEDGFYKLAEALASVATLNEEPIGITDLVNQDIIGGFDRRGKVQFGNVVTAEMATDDQTDLWNSFKPADLTVYDITSAVGIPLLNGTNGTMGDVPIENQTEYTAMLQATFGNEAYVDKDSFLYDPVIYDLDAYKIDAIFDCGWPIAVKKDIINMIDFRGDMVFLADYGLNMKYLDDIKTTAAQFPVSKYYAMYHNSFNVYDPYTRKEITVTMPYLLAPRLIRHISEGVGRPFAGIANRITFPEIIEGTINYLPVDAKQELVDLNVNYLSIYDGLPVMETMYTNDDEYTQLSYLHNVMAVQEIIKIIRTRCPRTRYTFLDGEDLENYIDDVESIINNYTTFFKSIEVQYMYDEKYEANNIFYAVLRVQFRNFIQEEFFKILMIHIHIVVIIILISPITVTSPSRC